MLRGQESDGLLAVVVGCILPDNKNVDVYGEEELGQLLHGLWLNSSHWLLQQAQEVLQLQYSRCPRSTSFIVHIEYQLVILLQYAGMRSREPEPEPTFSSLMEPEPV